MKVELAEAVHCEALHKCPDRLRDEIEVEFAKHDGFELLFTAPYTPKFNPIEVVWAYTKNDVAYQYHVDRTLAHVAIDIYNRWYGGTGRRDQRSKGGLDAVLAQKMAAHCEREMDDWISKWGESVGISGTIDALEVLDTYSDDGLALVVDVEGDDYEDM